MTTQTTQFRGVPDSPPPPKRRPKPYRTFATWPEYLDALAARLEEWNLRAERLDSSDPEERRRASTVASDGGQCMIYRRPS